jgi:RecA-family ATPase
MLSGDGGTGKSLLALQLGFATATGGKWIGQNVAPGEVLYVGAEDDQDELQRRLADITAGHSMSFESLSRLHLLCLAGEDAVLATFDKSNVMTKTPVWQSVVRNVERIRPRLAIFDTLADLFGGDEINRSQTKQFIQLLIGLALRYDLTVLLLSHPSIAGMKTNAGTSGSTAWSNSVRSRLYLNRVKDARDTELDPDARILTIKKANYGPVGASISLR